MAAKRPRPAGKVTSLYVQITATGGAMLSIPPQGITWHIDSCNPGGGTVTQSIPLCEPSRFEREHPPRPQAGHRLVQRIRTHPGSCRD